MSNPPLRTSTLRRYRDDALRMLHQLGNSGHKTEAEAAQHLHDLLAALVERRESEGKA